jgi:hypothetical protein
MRTKSYTHVRLQTTNYSQKKPIRRSSTFSRRTNTKISQTITFVKQTKKPWTNTKKKFGAKKRISFRWANIVYMIYNNRFVRGRLSRMIHDDGLSADYRVLLLQLNFNTGSLSKTPRSRTFSDYIYKVRGALRSQIKLGCTSIESCIEKGFSLSHSLHSIYRRILGYNTHAIPPILHFFGNGSH